MVSSRCCFAASRVIHERHWQLATCSALRIGAEESSGRGTPASPIPVIFSRLLGVQPDILVGRRPSEKTLTQLHIGR